MIKTIEPDPFMVNPCTFGLNEEENSFIRVNFDDYPSEVFSHNVWQENPLSKLSSLELPSCLRPQERRRRPTRSNSFDSAMSFHQNQMCESNDNHICDCEIQSTSYCCHV